MPVPASETSLLSMEEREFRAFRELIHRETGIWLRDGKQAMLASRLSRRLRHHGISDFASYLAYVETAQDGGREMHELINCITTNKTSFFREMHHFDFLAGTLVPEVFSAARQGGPRAIRFWSAACSTGEEPYSIAISVLAALEEVHAPGGLPHGQPLLPGGWGIDILASDIDTSVLATAARGVYSESSLEGISPATRNRCFMRGKGKMLGQVRVKKEVAQLVKFQRINLMDNTWPIEPGFDGVFFRNALIYFNRETQELFLRRMLRFLRPGGYLFLGHSEHVPWLHDAVVPLNQTVYRLRSARR